MFKVRGRCALILGVSSLYPSSLFKYQMQMKYTAFKSTRLRINHKERERSNKENRIDKVNQQRRDYSSLYSVLELDGTQTNNCSMSSGYCFHGY